jgi:hypothetical protein
MHPASRRKYCLAQFGMLIAMPSFATIMLAAAFGVAALEVLSWVAHGIKTWSDSRAVRKKDQSRISG